VRGQVRLDQGGRLRRVDGPVHPDDDQPIDAVDQVRARDQIALPDGDDHASAFGFGDVVQPGQVGVVGQAAGCARGARIG
jgi:hypothetical protein